MSVEFHAHHSPEAEHELQLELYRKLKEKYFDPELLESSILERFLVEGEVRNVKPIEELTQIVTPHKDRVLTAELIKPHKDQVLQAELVLPTVDKPLLTVYKPDNGENQGSLKTEKEPIPSGSSSPSNKDVASWLFGQALGIDHLLTPIVKRELHEGIGSLRTYLWGEPVELLSEQDEEYFFSDELTMEEIALYDYDLQVMDRRPANMLLTLDRRRKLIDNNYSFLPEVFTRNYTIKGPRLVVAYDNRYDPPRLRQRPIRPELRERSAALITNQDQLAHKLASYLTEQEINDTLLRVRKTIERGIYL
jgi:hypothetical protein